MHPYLRKFSRLIGSASSSTAVWKLSKTTAMIRLRIM